MIILHFHETFYWDGLIRSQTKTELFCFRYGHRPHHNAENGVIRKCSPEWSDLKTTLFENAVF